MCWLSINSDLWDQSMFVSKSLQSDVLSTIWIKRVVQMHQQKSKCDITFVLHISSSIYIVLLISLNAVCFTLNFSTTHTLNSACTILSCDSSSLQTARGSGKQLHLSHLHKSRFKYIKHVLIHLNFQANWQHINILFTCKRFRKRKQAGVW